LRADEPCGRAAGGTCEDAGDVVHTIFPSLPPQKFKVSVTACLAGKGCLISGPHNDQVEGPEQNTLTQEVAVWKKWIEGAERIVVEIVVSAQDASSSSGSGVALIKP
jgi:hypothetical protein